MARSESSEPPADAVGGSEASAEGPGGSSNPDPGAPGRSGSNLSAAGNRAAAAEGEPESADSPEEPWWNAGDEEFAGATPLFDGVRRTRPDPEPPPPRVDDVGSPIGEALKLAGAFMRWADESGLSDTLRELATEASAALSDSVSADTSDGPQPGTGPNPIHAVPLHRIPGEDGEPPQLVCDYCPVCRGMEVMRSVQPQMSQGVAEAMASVTSALNYAVEGFVRRQRQRDDD